MGVSGRTSTTVETVATEAENFVFNYAVNNSDYTYLSS
jgi:hypothetical protein